MEVRCHTCGTVLHRRYHRPLTSNRRDASTQTQRASEFSLSKCLDSGDFADVEISVESDVFQKKDCFKVHKVILAVQNDVFRAMFYGDFAKEDRVVITDLHPDGFRGLLRYFYSGRLELETVTQAACTRTAAAKYLVPDLAERCLTFVKDHMGTEDVCPFLDYVLTVHEEGLEVTARAIILKNSIGVILSSSFMRSTELTVRYILRHLIKVPEVLVVEAVRDWAEKQCLTGSRGDGERPDIRAVMQPFFSELRFLALTPAEFVQGPVAWNILTDAEALAIVSNIIKEGSMAMPEGFCQIRKARK